MQFIKRNAWTLSLVLVFAMVALCGDASAQANDIMTTAQRKTVNVFNSIKMIIFIVGGFGLVGLAFSAIFGKLKWTWFASLAVGLAILAAAGAIIQYSTGQQVNITDTFREN